MFRVIYICQVSSVEPNTAIQTLTGHQDEVNAVCWSPGGALLASCSDDSTAKIWTAEHGLKYDLRGHSKEIFTLRWTPTGVGSANVDKLLYLCTASFDGTVKVSNELRLLRILDYVLDSGLEWRYWRDGLQFVQASPASVQSGSQSQRRVHCDGITGRQCVHLVTDKGRAGKLLIVLRMMLLCVCLPAQRNSGQWRHLRRVVEL